MARNDESPTTPPHKPSAQDRLHVRTLAALGLAPAHIALLIRKGISEETLSELYISELNTGHCESAVKVAAAIHNRSVNHQNIPACALSVRNSSQPATSQTQAPEPSRGTARQPDTFLPQKQKRFVLIDGRTGEPIV